MPELPEVESIRRGIESHGVGRTITRVRVAPDRVTASRSLRMQPGGPGELIEQATDCRIDAAVRRGKFLWLLVGDKAILIHLGMSGQVLVQPRGASDPRNVRTRFELSDGTDLTFVDQRSFGYIAAVALEPTQDGMPGGCGSDAPYLPAGVAHIQRDLLDPNLDLDAVSLTVLRKRSQIKRVLLDQGVASGIGNIYADEALWRSRLHYGRTSSTLAKSSVDSVYAHARKVMAEALEVGGTSFDAQYVNTDGEAGYFSRSLAVYGREGMPCPRCGVKIRRDEFANRSSFYCPRCQSGDSPRAKGETRTMSAALRAISR